MVEAGFKTKIFTLLLALVAEILRWANILTGGAEMIYGIARPAIEDVLALLSQERYERIMAVIDNCRNYLTSLPGRVWEFLSQLCR